MLTSRASIARDRAVVGFEEVGAIPVGWLVRVAVDATPVLAESNDAGCHLSSLSSLVTFDDFMADSYFELLLLADLVF